MFCWLFYYTQKVYLVATSHLHNMDKVTHSDKNITVFGGLNFIFKAIKNKGLDAYLDLRLGYRSVFAKYSHSDVVLSLLGSSLAQGSFVSDIEIFREKYRDQFFNKIPSADTVEYVCQGLKRLLLRILRTKELFIWLTIPMT